MKSSKRAYYHLTADEVLAALHSRHEGLTEKEAAHRLEHDGPNQLEADVNQKLVVRYLKQFIDPMIGLLAASAMIALYLNDPRVAGILLVLVFLNTIIGFSQEYKAERVMRSLNKLAVSQAKIKRNDSVEERKSTEVVVGDIVFIEAGDAIPADLRLVTETGLKTNDFALTGESNPSRKFTHAISSSVPLGNRNNLVFMGTTVAAGSGYGVVVATGTHTELGRIADLSKNTLRGKSPLQKEMRHIAKRVTQGTLLLCAALLPFALYGGLEMKDGLLFAIAIAASIIPQGLPAEISTALAQAAGALSRRGALVKKLSAVETLGATTLICTDKTGTLTENQMTVERMLIGRDYYHVSGKGYNPKGSILDVKKHEISKTKQKELGLFFATALFSSNASISPPDKEHTTYYAIGDPTEAALITLAEKAGFSQQNLIERFPEQKEFPFDSDRKRMSSIRPYASHGKEQLFVFSKGAPEAILEVCTEIWDHGHVRAITKADKTFIEQQIEAGALDAMRTLGLAYRTLPKTAKPGEFTAHEAEQKLIWLGMVLMIDPIRDEVPAAMRAAHAAHMHVSIITGDHALTAQTIAARAGLADEHEDIIVINGEELADLSDKKLAALTHNGGVVFSRVAPEDKLRIVTIAQKHGHVVAVTGDGINDAPALKKADIGVAMGRTGTDVAKQSADIVLLDDSFTTLVKAIQQGRTVFQNIRKVVMSAFSSNAAELVVMITSLTVSALFHVPLALSVMQIVAIDLIAELFPVSALGKDKAEADVMKANPRKLDDHILNKSSIIDLAWTGMLIGGLAFANYLFFFYRHGISPSIVPAETPIHLKAMAVTYVTIVLCQLVNIIMRRSENGLFTKYQLHNRTFWIAIGFSILAINTIVYVPPVANYFLTGPIGLVDWLWVLVAVAVFIAVREFQRYDRRHHRKHIHALHRSIGI